MGGVAQGEAGVRELAGGDHRQPPRALPRLPLPRAIRGASPRRVEGRPAGLRESIMAEALVPPTKRDPAADKTSLITGSEAIAVACKLADVDVITAYPIRPYDAVAVRDLGWQLVWVDNAQEALDTALIAYRVAEDRRVFLPCAISCDGAFLTHSQALVKIPSQAKVDAFLPRYNRGDLQLHPDNPISVAPQANEDWLMEIRRQTASGMERSPGVIREAYADFEKIFGRSYGNPFFEQYMTDDADVVLVGMGTLSTPVKVAIRQMRAEGKKVGFVRVRWFRPFAAKELAETLGRFKAVGVIDRDFSLGSPFEGGILATEVRAALYPSANRPPLVGFIAGLGGREATLPDVKKMSEMILRAAEGKPQPATTWIGLRE